MLGSLFGRVLVETRISSPGDAETDWLEDPVTCWSAMRTPDDRALLGPSLGLAGETGRMRGNMLAPMRRIKNTGTTHRVDNSATYAIFSVRSQKRCSELVDSELLHDSYSV